MQYGYYSPKAITDIIDKIYKSESAGVKDAKVLGVNIYSSPEGKEKIVSGIDSDPECKNNNIPDKVLVGQVTEYIRPARLNEIVHLYHHEIRGKMEYPLIKIKRTIIVDTLNFRFE